MIPIIPIVFAAGLWMIFLSMNMEAKGIMASIIYKVLPLLFGVLQLVWACAQWGLFVVN